jgi:hypothetical protein
MCMSSDFARPALMCALLCLGADATAALAGERLQWSGAVTDVEGSAGGGLVPWALIGGLGTDSEVGGSGFATYVTTQDFSLRAAGLAVGVDDRLEISWARQRFDAGSVIPGITLGQDVAGLKLKVAGDALFAPDQFLPQIAVGAELKRTLNFDAVPRAIGAASGQDVDLYVAATKLYFAGRVQISSACSASAVTAATTRGSRKRRPRYS